MPQAPARQNTYLKQSTEDADLLSEKHKAKISAGQAISYSEYSLHQAGHVKVKLSTPIDGRTTWLAFEPHFDWTTDPVNAPPVKLKSSLQLKPNDIHIMIADWEDPQRFIGQAVCFDAQGSQLWKVAALCKGIEGSGRWTVRNGDTPPGLYKGGAITETQVNEPWEIKAAYGEWFVDLIELEDQESRVGRAGIGWHGGGTAAPDPLADYQQLVPTLGCVRSYNYDMDKVIVPAIRKVQRSGGTAYITVTQF